MIGEGRIGTIGVEAEEAYYASLTPEVLAVIESRDKAIELMKEGRISDAYFEAASSSRGAKSACSGDAPVSFARERYASDATTLRMSVVEGHLYPLREVKELADFEPPFPGLDQYEVIFRPVISAALSRGRREHRIAGAKLAVTGLRETFRNQSLTKVNFPDRNKTALWRAKVRAKFLARNAAALVANINDSKYRAFSRYAARG